MEPPSSPPSSAATPDPNITPNVPPKDVDGEREFAFREREIAAREREVSFREREVKSSPWQNPLVIGVFAAAIALFRNIFAVVSNNRNSRYGWTRSMFPTAAPLT
jgi:hypothetical protein